MQYLQLTGLFLEELSLVPGGLFPYLLYRPFSKINGLCTSQFTHWATHDTAIQFEGLEAIPLTSHVLLKILALRINECIIYMSVWKAITPSLQIIALPYAPEAISRHANSPYFEQCPTLNRWPSNKTHMKFPADPAVLSSFLSISPRF